MTDLGSELQRLRKRRRTRRRSIVLLTVGVLILAALWLTSARPTSDQACHDWQANDTQAVATDLGDEIGIDQMLALRPADCSIPFVPHPS